MLDLGEEAGMMPLEVGKDTDLLLPGQQRRFSDASDYDINFKPTPKGAMLVDSSLNSGSLHFMMMLSMGCQSSETTVLTFDIRMCALAQRADAIALEQSP